MQNIMANFLKTLFEFSFYFLESSPEEFNVFEIICGWMGRRCRHFLPTTTISTIVLFIHYLDIVLVNMFDACNN